jgi:histidinol phosphatase-like PHP family hydrolase
VENYLAAAEKHGLKTIGFANHCWAAQIQIPGMSPWHQGQDIEHVLKIKEQIPNDTRGIRILIGCETEYIGNGIAGLNKALADLFDFVLLPANHFNWKGFVVPEDLGVGGPKAVSELLYRRFMEVVDLGFGTAIVHPFQPLGFLEWEADVLNGISDAMYINCFKAAASAGLAIEINSYASARCTTCIAENGFSSLYLKIHSIARECGCKFIFGSDAHQIKEITAYEKMKQYAEACGIDDTELASLRASA